MFKNCHLCTSSLCIISEVCKINVEKEVAAMNEQPKLPGLETALEPGEPVFVLRAKDSLAPHMAALWGALAAGDTASAVSIFADTVSDPAHKYRKEPREAQKINSAGDKAQEMIEWRGERGLPIFGLHTVKA